MGDSKVEIRKQLDLHFGLRDFSRTRSYAEFSFFACFYELFNIPNNYWETSLSGKEIYEVFDLLKIRVNQELIKEQFLNASNHDVEVFHATDDAEVFAYLDLRKDPTDQNDMFLFGLRCPLTLEDEVCERLKTIYKKLQTASPFSYDRFNHVLYKNSFHSYSYFYENDYREDKRKLNHHNL